MGRIELGRDTVVLACAISAGIHGALVPQHLSEGTAAGLAFAVVTALLAALAAAVTLRPARSAPVVAAAAVFGGLLASYALATTTGLPVLHPEPEPVDGLALATKAVEAIGFLAALYLLRRGRPAVVAVLTQPKGT
jgi:hypothetical protein